MLGIEGMRGAEEMQATLLANKMGLPGAKFACEELEKFAEEKQYLNEKLALYKEANPFSGYGIDTGDVMQAGAQGVAKGVAGGITTAGLEGIGKIIRGAARSIHNRLFLNKERERIVDEISKNDPIVSTFEAENPGVSIKAYSTLVRTAPTLSLDPNIATAFLRNATQAGGPMDFQTIKLLADAEQSLKRARGEGGN